MALCSLKYSRCVLLQWIWLTLGSLVFLLGTVGNFLTFAVMCSKTLRTTTFGHYLAAVSVMDTLVIWTGMTRHIVKYASAIDIRQLSEASCQVQRFFLYSSTGASAWLLTAVTIERYLCIFFPAHYKNHRSLTRTRIIITSLTLLMFATNLHIFWTTGKEVKYASVDSQEEIINATRSQEFSGTGNSSDELSSLIGNTTAEGLNDLKYNYYLPTTPEQSLQPVISRISMCGYPEPRFREFWHNYQTWIGLTINCLLPFVLMLSLNAAIIYKLKQRDSVMTNYSREHTKGAKINTGCADASAEPTTHSTSSTPKAGKRHGQSLKTRMLLPVTMFFLVVGVPSFIFQGLEFLIVIKDEDHEAQVEFIDGIVTLVWYLNYATNFVFYCITGQLFRSQLRAIFQRSFKHFTCLCLRRLRCHSGSENVQRQPAEYTGTDKSVVGLTMRTTTTCSSHDNVYSDHDNIQ